METCVQWAHSGCQCPVTLPCICSLWAAFCLLTALCQVSLSPSYPFRSLSVVFCPTDFHPKTLLRLIPPPYFCLQDLGFMCLNDLFQYFNHISRPTFSLTPPTSPSSADFLLLAQLLPSALGPLYLVLLRSIPPLFLPHFSPSSL